MTIKRILRIFSGLVVFIFLTAGSVYADTLGDKKSFFVNTDYDYSGRDKISATLRKEGSHVYIYVADDYWNSLSGYQTTLLNGSLDNLVSEFDGFIYPKEIEFWGSEWNPGIDNNSKITILISRLIDNAGGYVDTTNEVSITTLPNSNEREMFVISTKTLGDFSKLKAFVGHEFFHLIEFYQKEKLHGVSDDIWLNELRADFSPTILGYDDDYRGSNLEKRASSVLANKNDSLTEWKNEAGDYGMVLLFAEYMADVYGRDIWSDSLHSNLTDFDSIEDALSKKGITRSAKDFFGDWLITLLINNKNINSKYGYSNSDLTNFKVSPNSYYIIDSGELSIHGSIKDWQPNWYQISGSVPNLKIDFSAPGNLNNYSVTALKFEKDGRIEIKRYNPGVNPTFYLSDFSDASKVVLIPYRFEKRSGFGQDEPSYNINLKVSSVDSVRHELQNGDLIRMSGGSDIYVIDENYKRLLLPEVIDLYGQLVGREVFDVEPGIFFSYETSPLVRYVNDEKVYSVWGDRTKHWLNISGEQFTSSGRKWNSVFIINENEFNFYREGARLTR